MDQTTHSAPGTKIKRLTNVVFNIIFIIISLGCIIPFLFIVITSFASESSIARYGYTLWPKEFSLVAYKYLFTQTSQLLNSYEVSIFITVVGTILGLYFNATMGYALSRDNYKLKKFFTYMILITMLFNGGMISYYLVVARLLNLSDNLLALILPPTVSAFNIIILRTFFKQSIPDSVVESAKIDGAGQFTIFFKIVLPMSLPALATIGLFLTFGYWNDWFNAMLFIDKGSLMPLQEFMMNVLSNVSFLQQNSAAMGGSSMSTINSIPQQSAQMAIVVLSTLPIVCTYPFFQKYFITGLTIGAVKG